jgi:uncharacterized low-complexity protein
MQKKTELKTVAAALGAGFAVSLTASPVAQALDNPFAVTQFDAGYMVAAEGGCGGEKAAEGACGGEKKAEGACGGEKAAEGACGGEKKAEGACGGEKSAEGKCGN